MDAKQDMEAILDLSATDAALMAERLLNQIEMSQEPMVQGADSEEMPNLEALVDNSPVVEVLSHEIDDIDIGLDRAALYAEQGVGRLAVADPEDVAKAEAEAEAQAQAPAFVDAKRSSRKRKQKVEAPSPTLPADTVVEVTKSAALKKRADVNGLTALGYTSEEVATLMARIDGAPKKVADKATNLIRYALGREHISNFTRFALLKLRSDPSGFTTPQLVEMLQNERSYTIGTARSQAQQQSRLFTLFEMASKDGSKITLEQDNPLAKAVLARLTGDAHLDPKGDELEAADNDGEVETKQAA